MKIRELLIGNTVFLSFAFAFCFVDAKAIEVGETCLLDVTGAGKNWESGTVIGKDGSGYTIRMLGVGEHKGEFHVPEHYIHGYHQNVAATPPAASSTANASVRSSEDSADIKIGQDVLLDVTGAAKNWETGTVIAKNASGYTIRMLGVGEHKGEFHVPLNYIHGYHKAAQTPQHNASWASPSISHPSIGSPAKAATTNQSAPKPGFTNDAWKSMSDDIDARIKKVNSNGNPAANTGPAKAVSGSKGLSGLYLRHEQVFMGTSLSYNEDHYLFFPDGRLYHGIPPEGPSNFNWAKEQQTHPERCGQYGINGDKITLSYGGKEPIVWPVKVKSANDMELNYAPTVKVEKFGANARISGTYGRGSSFGANYSYAGAPTVTSAGSYTFNLNGTVSNDSLSGIEGDTKTTGVTVGVQQAKLGTYTINGNDMTLNLGNRSMRCTVYPVSDRGNQQPARISVDGALYERKK